jgi:hypothetical protein
MNARTIIAVEPGIDETLVRLQRAPWNIPNAEKWHPFDLDPDQMPQWTDPGAVREHGTRIYNALSTHPAILQALTQLAATPVAGESAMYFSLTQQAAERLYWESIYLSGAFAALDARWPVARIAASTVDRPEPAHQFRPPLKVAAIISAAGIDGRAEWESLKNAVTQARAKGLPVAVDVFTGQQAVLDAVQQDVAAGLTDVTVAPVPGDRVALADLLEDSAPHVLHLFCHGAANAGVANLQIGTLLDEINGVHVGSLRMRVADIRSIPALEKSWLIVLNACDTGAAAEKLHSLAHQLVQDLVPACIGMMEPVDAADASIFTENLYGSLFAEIQRAAAALAGSSTEQVQWCRALRRPREAVLSQRYNDDPDNNRAWALPILYVSPNPFLICQAPAAPAADIETMRLRAKEVAGVLRALPADVPEYVRDGLLDIIADLPPEMRPDRHGQFP